MRRRGTIIGVSVEVSPAMGKGVARGLNTRQQGVQIVSINSKQYKGIAKKFGRSVDEVREIAAAAEISSVSELTAHLESLANGAAPEPEPGADEVADAAPAPAEPAAKSGRGRKPEHPEPEWFAAMGRPGGAWRNWHRFFTGTGPADLATLVPGCTLDQQTVVGIWKSGGKGMNTKKLVQEVAARMKAVA
jgi:hypothetical protein